MPKRPKPADPLWDHKSHKGLGMVVGTCLWISGGSLMGVLGRIVGVIAEDVSGCSQWKVQRRWAVPSSGSCSKAVVRQVIRAP